MITHKITACIVLIFISLSQLHAQQGKITGTVIDKKTQETLIGVNITIDSTTSGAVTDMDGNYELKDLQKGNYTLTFSYIGYADKKISGVLVQADATTTLNVSLDESANELQEVQIQDYKRTNTETAVLLELKNATQIASGISASQISKTSDRDASQVVKRIPGVLISGSFINIRGLNQRYNNVMLQDAIAPSLETDIRSFSFDVIPSAQLDRIIIYKSPSADIPGDFAGGVVKIYTKNLPDSNYWQIGYTTTFRTGTSFQKFYQQKVGAGNYIGLDTKFRLDKNSPGDLRNIDESTLEKAGESLNNDWTTQNRLAMQDQRISFTKGTRLKKEKVLIGNITAINYSISKTHFDIQRADYEAYDTEHQRSVYKYNFMDEQYTTSVKIGLLHNWVFKIKNHNIAFNNLLNCNAQNQYVNRHGTDYSSNIEAHNQAFDHLYRGVYAMQFSDKTDLSKIRSELNWMAGYNYTYRNQPDFKKSAADVDTATGKEVLRIPTGSATPEVLGRFFSKMKEHSATASVSLLHRFTTKERKVNLSPVLVVGQFLDYKNRNFTARNLGFVVANISMFDANLKNGTLQQLFSADNINNTSGIKLDETTNKSDQYNASSILSATYANLDLSIAKKLHIIAGLRYEMNIQRLQSATLTGDAIKVNNIQHAILPSLNISYSIVPKLILRAAYGMSVNRPEFREIAPFGFYDFNISYVMKGNPNLKNCTIHNADLRLEYYPTNGEGISLAGFYKHFINPIETFTKDLGNRTFSFQNAQNAQAYGLEIEVRKNFSRTTTFLKDFSLVLNASYIKSKVHLDSTQALGQSNNRPLQGQAPFMVNAGIFYNNKDKRIQFNLLYNITGKRILYVGAQDYPDIYEMPRHSLDFNASYTFKKQVELSLGLTDLINQQYVLLQDGNSDRKLKRKQDQVFQSYKTGTQISLGVKYTF